MIGTVKEKYNLNLQRIMFQIVQTRFKNLAANAKLLNSVWPFFDMKHYYRIK